MKFKFENVFFGQKKVQTVDNGSISITDKIKINKGSISTQDGGCFGESHVKVTLPHITFDKKDSDSSEDYSYTFKF
ncbi:hypothetical protein Lsan_3911 [Legionella santicrucis]|uniref:Uncharacterized protein n=1 Tax=Legionella santicrucis TaxID=45074 RepID=A0A0W0Y983_9GAMM|nr:hypothetical protein [Legionella santicrucis]KTD53501.1 hypothetical protein Lsan_3911 [Legionella santicrucis]